MVGTITLEALRGPKQVQCLLSARRRNHQIHAFTARIRDDEEWSQRQRNMGARGEAERPLLPILTITPLLPHYLAAAQLLRPASNKQADTACVSLCFVSSEMEAGTVGGRVWCAAGKEHLKGLEVGHPVLVLTQEG